ncbi:5'-nucleotidase C-terminal domain-containing protein [Nocardioides sp. C4-1]|uniref:5'-nucleotidase C-terminal domain-containing protein n=1 Tax=Nocardioides sp. C4-1 TaxID=3151851 RepID=UPI003267E5BC
MTVKQWVARAAAAAVLAPGLALLAVAPAPSSAAPGDVPVAWAEVEDGALSGGPAQNSGDHGNFSGTGSYTFRETGMTSTMTVTVPEAGSYPVWIRYAAGPLSTEENKTRSMGLLTNGGNRQVVQYDMTSFADWETWRFARADVTLNAGANTIAVNCDRGTDFCRLNFDAIQVGGTAPDTCLPTPTTPGWTSLFDGTFATFDGWRKSGGGGFGRQTDCSIRSTRGSGVTWFTTQQANDVATVRLDWRRNDLNDDSSVYLGSTARTTPASGGHQVMIGDGTGNIVTNGATKAATAVAVSGALRPIGQWNTFEIELTPKRMRVLLNDVVVNTLDRTGTPTATGFVGLEHRGGFDTVDFRDIQALPDVAVGRLDAAAGRSRLAGGTVDPTAESTLANLVAEAQRDATDTDLSFVDPGTLAGDLGTDVGYRAAAAALPSSDVLTTMRLTGQQVTAALEQQWRAGRTAVVLGSSSGLTYTYDPAAAEGSRVSGVRIDGVALAPAATYTAAVPATLAAGDRIPAFATGTQRVTTTTTGLAAVLAHLDSPEPTAVDTAQHAVGVTFPGGRRASYLAGEALALDLSGLSFSAPGDVVDETVAIELGSASLGTVAVTDGAATVRATVPAGLPAGPAVVGVTGATTGTVVEVPVTIAATSSTTVTVSPASVAVRSGKATVSLRVAAGSNPTGQVRVLVNGVAQRTVTLAGGRATTTVGPFPTVGARTVTARYLGTGTIRPSTSAAARVVVAKARPTVSATVAPTKVIAGRTRPKVTVQVRATALTPSGRVTVKVAGRSYAGTLRGGKVTIALAKIKKAGTLKAVVTYGGDPFTAAGSTSARIRVKKK